MAFTESSSICFTHPDRELILVCTSCAGSFVCVKCITTTHLNHNCVEIDDYLESVKEQRQERQNVQQHQRQEILQEFTLSSIQRRDEFTQGWVLLSFIIKPIK